MPNTITLFFAGRFSSSSIAYELEVAMAGYAFIRSETYAQNIAKGRKSTRTTVAGAAYEADRLPGYSEHVDDLAKPGHRLRSGPQPPVLFYGCAPSLVPKMVEKDVARKKKELRRTGWKIYKTTHTVQSSLVSVPVTPAAYETDPNIKDWVDAFFQDALAYLQTYAVQRGGELVSAVLHLDENYVHMHTFALPRNVAAYRARELDPAGAAAEQARRDGANKRMADRAASASCERFRQDFGVRVAKKYGLETAPPSQEPRKSRNQLKHERLGQEVEHNPSAGPGYM